MIESDLNLQIEKAIVNFCFSGKTVYIIFRKNREKF